MSLSVPQFPKAKTVPSQRRVDLSGQGEKEGGCLIRTRESVMREVGTLFDDGGALEARAQSPCPIVLILKRFFQVDPCTATTTGTTVPVALTASCRRTAWCDITGPAAIIARAASGASTATTCPSTARMCTSTCEGFTSTCPSSSPIDCSRNRRDRLSREREKQR